jgi:hypothetical protein
MGVIDPADVGTLDGTDTLVSIEHVAFTGGGVVTAAADGSSQLQIAPPTQDDDGRGALAEWIATHLSGARQAWLDAGHRGRLSDIHEDWTEHGFNLFAHSSAKSALFSVEGVTLGGDRDGHGSEPGRHEDAHDDGHGWIRGGAGADSGAREQRREHVAGEAKISQAAPKVDWNDSCRGLAAPFPASGRPGGARAGGQANLASFDTSPKKKTSR